MLCADVMPSSHHPALQQRERGFNRVGVRIALDVDFQLVANRLVPSLGAKILCGTLIGVVIIGEQDFDILAQIFGDILFQSLGLHVFSMEETEFATTLTDADYDFFVVEPRAYPVSLIHSADEGFVHFDFSVEHSLFRLNHCGADSVAEVPCGLVADSESALDLASGHSLFRFAQEIGCGEPLFERKMRIVEDRPGCHGELIAA